MSDQEHPEGDGEQPKPGAGGAAVESPEAPPEPKDGGKPPDEGEETPEPSAFESMTLADIAKLKDDELAGFHGWLDSLPEERKQQFPGARQAAEADTRRAADDRRETEDRETQERLHVLDRQANQARDRVIEILRTAGEGFYEKVKTKAGDDFDLEGIPFDISAPEIQAALDQYAAARVPKLADTSLRNHVVLIQDAIEEQGEPLTRDDIERMLEEANKAGKSGTWAFLQEVARRANAAGRKAEQEIWEAKMPGERAAIRTLLEKEMHLEPEHGGGGGGGGSSVDLSTIRGIHEARRNGKITDAQAVTEIRKFA